MGVISTVYFGIYVAFYLCFVISSFKQAAINKKIIAGILVLFLILFTGLRWETGTDWDSYINLYSDLSWETFFANKFSHYDIGYRLINLLVKSFGGTYSLFLVTISLIAVLAIYRAIKEINAELVLALVIFYANFYLSFFMGSNRLMIALGMDLLGIIYLVNGERKRSIVAGVIGFLFHRSSIVYAIVYILPKKMYKVKDVAIITIVSYIIGAWQLTRKIMEWMLLIAVRYIPNAMLYQLVRFYVDELHEDLGSRHFDLAAIKRAILIFVLYFIYQNMTRKKCKKFEHLYNLYVLSVCIYLVFNGLGVFQVLSTYFAMVEIVLWSCLYTLVNRNNKMLLIIFLFFLYFIEVMNAFPLYYSAYVPYTSVFSLR